MGEKHYSDIDGAVYQEPYSTISLGKIDVEYIDNLDEKITTTKIPVENVDGFVQKVTQLVFDINSYYYDSRKYITSTQKISLSNKEDKRNKEIIKYKIILISTMILFPFLLQLIWIIGRM